MSAGGEDFPAVMLARVNAWLQDYVRRFRSTDPMVDENICLKIDHTRRVELEVLALGEEQRRASGFVRLARAAALLHDVGRFEQFARYRTFDDARSEDHARLGCRVLHEERALSWMPEPAARWLLEAVRLHNVPRLPAISETPLRELCELLRDADKLDIWRMVTDDYARHGGVPDRPFYRGLPRRSGVSPAVVAQAKARQPISFAEVRQLNDYVVLQGAMAFDLNCPAAFRRVQERGVLATIRGVLPPGDGALDEIFADMAKFVAERGAAT